jgi:hypothetical protein
MLFYLLQKLPSRKLHTSEDVLPYKFQNPTLSDSDVAFISGVSIVAMLGLLMLGNM